MLAGRHDRMLSIETNKQCQWWYPLKSHQQKHPGMSVPGRAGHPSFPDRDLCRHFQETTDIDGRDYPRQTPLLRAEEESREENQILNGGTRGVIC